MIKKNKFSIIISLVILFLSLVGSGTLEKVDFFDMSFTDKIAHAGMYFGLMSAIIYENRKELQFTSTLLLISLIPFFYGIIMEILQEFLTATRTGSIYDAIFNTLGIIAALILWQFVKPHINKTIK